MVVAILASFSFVSAGNLVLLRITSGLSFRIVSKFGSVFSPIPVTPDVILENSDGNLPPTVSAPLGLKFSTSASSIASSAPVMTILLVLTGTV
ncbi:hypothetical protein D3C73_1135390 [compost metagenome]